MLLAGNTSYAANASNTPDKIVLGTVYSSSGRYASISMPSYYGLKLWADSVNNQGGVYVGFLQKKVPIKLVSYDGQSNTATISNFYNRLITQDKVDIFVSDAGSVLTAPAVTIARTHKKLLFNPTGTGATFYSSDNPYIVQLSDPVSNYFVKNLSDFLIHDGPSLGIKALALLYSTNDFSGGQAHSLSSTPQRHPGST